MLTSYYFLCGLIVFGFKSVLIDILTAFYWYMTFCVIVYKWANEQCIDSVESTNWSCSACYSQTGTWVYNCLFYNSVHLVKWLYNDCFALYHCISLKSSYMANNKMSFFILTRMTRQSDRLTETARNLTIFKPRGYVSVGAPQCETSFHVSSHFNN